MGSPEKKVVLRLDLHDDKAKQKAMKAVSTVSGIDSVSIHMKEMKMTVIGVADPVIVVSKLRKSWRTEILSIGPAKEPPKPEEKKEEPKKEEAKPEEKKEEPKKEEPKKEEPKPEEPKKEEKKEEPKEEPKKEEKKEEPKKEEPKKDPSEQFAEFVRTYRFHNQYMTNPYMPTRYAVQSVEEDPNQCSIL